MANELRQRQVAIGGLVENNPLGSSGTTLTSAGLASITGGVDSSHHMAITLDPDGTAGNPEIAWITALTSGAGSATILRGQEGTTARQHAQNIKWVHGPTVYDIEGDGWHTPTFQNSWANLDTATYGAAKYRKAADGLVTMFGYIGTGSNGSTAFTLPVGYRPSKTLYLAIITGSPAASNLIVGADGTVKPPIGGGTGSFIHASFYAEQ